MGAGTAEPIAVGAGAVQPIRRVRIRAWHDCGVAELNRPTIWIDGVLYADSDQALIPADDHGLVAGDGVFETCKIEPWGAFALGLHIQRLQHSAKTLGLPTPDESEVRAGVAAVLAVREFDYGRLRITWTGGVGPLSSGHAFGPPRLIVAASSASRASGPGRLATVPWTRNPDDPLSGIKTTSYAGNVRALAWAHDRGADEALFCNTRGEVCEASGSNIFLVFGDRVVTPTLAAGPLAGITRRCVIEQSGAEEADLSLAEAKKADEVFLTGSLRDVHPIVDWDGQLWEVGPVTSAVAKEFAARSAADPDPR
ncbi:branched-chain amino acid aminotransferase [Naumannella halotolerans]|uniref:Branched-chain amino acid aminotransferase n=1 Tax=Naumannella halotolerans TaxID=993414 RepID=A0A4R7JA87_9ACTN|nr:branched-chain amino acid aminotransferase [Naumannella halotolerans]